MVAFKINEVLLIGIVHHLAECWIRQEQMIKPPDVYLWGTRFHLIKDSLFIDYIERKMDNPLNHQNKVIHDKENCSYRNCTSFDLAKCQIWHDQMIKYPDVIYMAACFTRSVVLLITLKLSRRILQILEFTIENVVIRIKHIFYECWVWLDQKKKPRCLMWLHISLG